MSTHQPADQQINQSIKQSDQTNIIYVRAKVNYKVPYEP